MGAGDAGTAPAAEEPLAAAGDVSEERKHSGCEQAARAAAIGAAGPAAAAACRLQLPPDPRSFPS